MILEYIQRRQKYKVARLTIKGKIMKALVADSSTKRMIGLMYRNSIPQGTCMLFVFDGNGRHGIWMRNMKFPIDVLWLDADLRVVDYVEGIKPCTSIFNCKTYEPKKDAKYIVELNSGFVKKNKVRLDTSLTLKWSG